MTWLLLAMFFLAIGHFVFEGILAPSFRLEIRYKLFKLRDELRTLKMQHRDGFDDKHFYYLQDSINTMLKHMPAFELVPFISATEELKRNAELRERMKARAAILDDCPVEEARRIRESVVALAADAFRVNGAGWLFYVLPIAVAVACYEASKETVRQLVSLSEPDMEKVVPVAGAPAQAS